MKLERGAWDWNCIFWVLQRQLQPFSSLFWWLFWLSMLWKWSASSAKTWAPAFSRCSQSHRLPWMWVRCSCERAYHWLWNRIGFCMAGNSCLLKGQTSARMPHYCPYHIQPLFEWCLLGLNRKQCSSSEHFRPLHILGYLLFCRIQRWPTWVVSCSLLQV